MEEIGCIIVDDEPKGREVLKALLEEYCTDVAVRATAASVAEAVKLIKKHEPDIVFLDIEMPHQNGFMLFDHFPEMDFEVIFTTAYDEYALRAIRFSALDYLLKPINVQELKEAVQKYLSRLNRLSDPRRLKALKANIGEDAMKQLALPTQDGYEIANISDIIRCASEGSYTEFHLNSGAKVVVSRNMGEFEQVLHEAGFFRIHHSHMINLRYLRTYVRGRGGHVILTDGTEVDVAARRKDAFLKAIGLE